MHGISEFLLLLAFYLKVLRSKGPACVLHDEGFYKCAKGIPVSEIDWRSNARSNYSRICETNATRAIWIGDSRFWIFFQIFGIKRRSRKHRNREPAGNKRKRNEVPASCL